MDHRIENLQYGLHTIHFECWAKTFTLPRWREKCHTTVTNMSVIADLAVELKLTLKQLAQVGRVQRLTVNT